MSTNNIDLTKLSALVGNMDVGALKALIEAAQRAKKERSEEIRAISQENKRRRLGKQALGRFQAILWPIAKKYRQALTLADDAWLPLVAAVETLLDVSFGSQDVEDVRAEANRRILHREANPIKRHRRPKA